MQSRFPDTAGVDSQQKLPPHLRDLYDCSTANLSKEEAHEVHLLLGEFADVFSEGSSDFGKTIDTGATVPIRQLPSDFGKTELTLVPQSQYVSYPADFHSARRKQRELCRI